MLKLTKKFMMLPNRERLAYVEHGHGDETILLIHGNMSSSLHYLPLIERLDPQTYHVVAVDLRGFGDSSYESRFDTLRALTDDVAMFLKQLNLPKLTVVGWSAGGGIAMQLAAFYPQSIKKIFLIDSMSYKGMPVFKKDKDGRPMLGQVYASKEELALDPIQVAPAVAALATHNVAFMDYIWGLVIYTVNKPTPEYNQLYLEETMKQRNLVDFDWSLVTFNMGTGSNFQTEGDNSIELIKVPVCSVYGKKDITVLEYMVKETVTALKDLATQITYENCGHSPLVDVPDQLAKDLIEFVNK